jgi:hypothetical protein
MSKEEVKQPKPRITSWIKQNFGEDILEEIRRGKRTIKFNGTEIDAKSKNFCDKRVIPTSKIEIIPEPIIEKSENKTGLVPRDITQEEKVKEPEPKIYVKNFLTEDQIKSVTSGKANVFIDGLATTLDKEVEIDNDTEPTLDGKQVIIKVLPQFAPG